MRSLPSFRTESSGSLPRPQGTSPRLPTAPWLHPTVRVHAWQMWARKARSPLTHAQHHGRQTTAQVKEDPTPSSPFPPSWAWSSAFRAIFLSSSSSLGGRVKTLRASHPVVPVSPPLVSWWSCCLCLSIDPWETRTGRKTVGEHLIPKPHPPSSVAQPQGTSWNSPLTSKCINFFSLWELVVQRCLLPTCQKELKTEASFSVVPYSFSLVQLSGTRHTPVWISWRHGAVLATSIIWTTSLTSSSAPCVQPLGRYVPVWSTTFSG